MVLFTAFGATCVLWDLHINVFSNARLVVIVSDCDVDEVSAQIPDNWKVLKRCKIHWRKNDQTTIYLSSSTRELFIRKHFLLDVNWKLEWNTCVAVSLQLFSFDCLMITFLCSVLFCLSMIVQRSEEVSHCNLQKWFGYFLNFCFHQSQAFQDRSGVGYCFRLASVESMRICGSMINSVAAEDIEAVGIPWKPPMCVSYGDVRQIRYSL